MTILTKKNYYITVNDNGVEFSRLAKGKMWTKFYKISTMAELALKLKIVEELTEEEWAWLCGWRPENLRGE